MILPYIATGLASLGAVTAIICIIVLIINAFYERVCDRLKRPPKKQTEQKIRKPNIHSKGAKTTMTGTTVTVISIIVIAVLVFIVAGVIAFVFWDNNPVISVLAAVAGIALIAFLIYTSFYTESGKRRIKNWDSNLGGGLPRQVRVYDMDGDLIESYEGTFDIEYADERILFDDEDGNRHVIYFKTGTVIVDELNTEDEE